ncbi:MAG TPA: hypothetical protein VKU60_14145 [Chloroflexota bacterium]|nr:hypothetical protein [Chloroflexota bacterium]
MDLHLPRGLPSRQARFLCLLTARPTLNRADYQRLIAVSYVTAKRDLAQLTAAHLIIPVGRTRTRRYALSPLTLLPSGAGRRIDVPEKGLMCAGSSGSDLGTVSITIEALSVHGGPS